MHLYIASVPIVPLFLFKLSVSLTIVWCFYQAVLRRLTFHVMNRWYLLGYTLLACVIPFINIGPMLEDGPGGGPIVLQFIPAIGGSAGSSRQPLHGSGVSAWTVLAGIQSLVAVLLLLRLSLRWWSLVRLRRQARLIEGAGVRVYQVDRPIVPFSFGTAIYINQRLHTEREWEDIILHEYVHIKQHHTIDILVAELICAINWYNPFAWLIRYSIRQNLEFIADQQVLDKGVDRKGYQYHLLKVVGEARYELASNFNISSLKRRIVMMNKVRSARVHLLKLLFLLPLAAVTLLAFRDRYGKLLSGGSGQVVVNAAGLVMSLPEKTPVAHVLVTDRSTGLETRTDDKGFYKLTIPAEQNKPIRVHLRFTKDGYDSTFGETWLPTVTETKGVLISGVVIRHGATLSGVFSVMPAMQRNPVPVEPGYADAVADWQRVVKLNESVQKYMQMQKDHPEISLFYQTEDHRKEIVVHNDGTIERFGYDGTPDLDALHKKYGDMGGFMAGGAAPGPLPNKGYLARWAAIGERTQSEFKSTNPTVRAIIFPGDSRVIAVPESGKVKFYDMDNGAAAERSEFERLYGKLPDCVPPPGFNSDEAERAAGRPVQVMPRSADTGVKEKKDPSAGFDRPSIRPDAAKDRTADSSKPLYFVDGKQMPSNWNAAVIPAEEIKSVYVYDRKAAIPKYGKKGANGVVAIITKKPGKDWSTVKPPAPAVYYRPDTLRAIPRVAGQPLLFVNGREEPYDSLRTLNPNMIKSIKVLKDSSAWADYGEKGRNGVLLVTLKSSEADGHIHN